MHNFTLFITAYDANAKCYTTRRAIGGIQAANEKEAAGFASTSLVNAYPMPTYGRAIAKNRTDGSLGPVKFI